MLVVVVEPDAARATDLARQLRLRGYIAMRVSQFAPAERMLMSAARPAALYVAEVVPPLTGADLLAVIERNPRLAGVPVVARVGREQSLLAATLRRGGVHVVGEDEGAARVAEILVANTASYDEADWRASLIAWSRFLQWRHGYNRERLWDQRSRMERELDRAVKLVTRNAQLRRARFR